jgi:CMP-N-acetylneuraminic acid synthetase
MRILGIVPARKGSKRFPDKNRAELNGVKLWEMAYLQGKPFCDRIVVSTDDEEIIRDCIANKYEYLRRDARYATDDSPTMDVVLEADMKYPDYDMFVILQPTSPLRDDVDIHRCIESVKLWGGYYYTTDLTTMIRFEPNGAVYAMTREHLLTTGFKGGLWLYMPESRSVDINTEADFEAVKKILQEGRSNGQRQS